MSATSITTGPIWFIDGLARVLVSGDETGGRLALVEIEVPRGHMPPLHVHRSEDESFFVLDGELTLYVGEEALRLDAGDAAVAPMRVPHTFRVESETARILVAAAPAGFDRFVAAVGEPATQDVLPGEPVLPDPERFAEICREFEIELLGPPGALPS
jgi:quercetin dioxygenase-like cupin family protein